MTSSGALEFHGRALHAGAADGQPLLLTDPLSFWGGTSTQGMIIDANHPQHGQSISGRVVVMESGRGSSSSSTVLAEQLRTGNGPAALVLGVADPILVVGALVAAELYGIELPVMVLERTAMCRLVDAVSGPARYCARVRADAGSGSSPGAAISLSPLGPDRRDPEGAGQPL